MRQRHWGSKKMQMNESEDPASQEMCGGFEMVVPSKESVSGEDGHIWFYQDVGSKASSELAIALHRAAQDRQMIQIKTGLESPPPIHLHIQSDGGDLLAGMALADAVTNCPVPVYTYIEGNVASAATLISLSGKKRFIGKNSYIMIHQISSAFWGKYEELKDLIKNNDQLMAHIKSFYEVKTKMPAEQIAEVLKHDLWFNAESALTLGLVDAIL